MFDADGKFTYSKTVKADVRETSSSIKIFPNPVTSTLNMQMPFAVNGNADLKITDATGKILLHQILNGNNNGVTAAINKSKLSAGLYYLTVTANNTTESGSFIKQ